jgi:flavin-dependent dehydrogenase
MAKERFYDVIISGAGPAGLSAGIILAEKGLDVLICEKGEKPGPEPRAETVYDHHLFDQLIRPGFMKEAGLYETSKRKFNSPGALKNFDLELGKGRMSIVFEWDDLIEGLYGRAKKAGVSFRFQKEVTAPLIEKGICRGVKLADGKSFTAETTLACDGHQSRLGSGEGIAYREMNSVIIKSVVKNFVSDYRGFEYFFIAHDELEYAGGFPPAVGFIFPRGGNMAETGLYIPSAVSRRIDPEYLDLDYEYVRDVWHLIKKNYPRLSHLLRGSETVFEKVTAIPVGAFHEKPVITPGLIFAGDAIGFVEATGASGIVTSMENAAFAADFIIKNRNNEWDEDLKNTYNKSFAASEPFKYVKKRSMMAAFFYRVVFTLFRSAKMINRNWWFVKLVYKFK